MTLPRLGFERAHVTVETERTELKEGIVPLEKLVAMDDETAFRTMERNHAIAIDKVVARSDVTVDRSAVKFALRAPHSPGHYWVRVFASGGGHVASGATRIDVQSP